MAQGRRAQRGGGRLQTRPGDHHDLVRRVSGVCSGCAACLRGPLGSLAQAAAAAAPAARPFPPAKNRLCCFLLAKQDGNCVLAVRPASSDCRAGHEPRHRRVALNKGAGRATSFQEDSFAPAFLCFVEAKNMRGRTTGREEHRCCRRGPMGCPSRWPLPRRSSLQRCSASGAGLWPLCQVRNAGWP